jgi:microcystin-dependent protein
MAGIIQKGARRFITQIGAAGVPDAVATTIPLVSTTGLPTDTTVEIIVDRTDSGGNFTPLKEEVIRGTVSGNNLINCTRGVEGSAQAHSAGAVVNQILTSSMWNEFSQYVKDVGLVMYPVGSIYTSVVNTNPNTFFGGTWISFATGRTLVGVDTGQTEFDTVEETGGAKTHTLTTNEMPSHTHTQDSHNHTQNSHNHTQDAHNHGISDPSHQHGQYTTANANSGGGIPRADYDGDVGNYTAYTQGVNTVAAATGISINNATATNQATTATNQATTATNQNTGGGAAHNNLQPYITVYMWKRTA